MKISFIYDLIEYEKWRYTFYYDFETNKLLILCNLKLKDKDK